MRMITCREARKWLGFTYVQSQNGRYCLTIFYLSKKNVFSLFLKSFVITKLLKQKPEAQRA